MHFNHTDQVFDVTAGALRVIQNRSQQAELVRANLVRSAESLVRSLQSVTPRSAKDKYSIEQSRLTAGTKTPAVGVSITNNDPAFGTYLSGSATKNVDSPGAPYKIEPVTKDFLAFGNDEHGRPMYRPQVLFQHLRKNGSLSKRLQGGLPGTAFESDLHVQTGEPVRGELTNVTKLGKLKNTKSGGFSLTASAGKYKKTFNFSKDGRIIVKYVTHHPGRPPYQPLRDKILALSKGDDNPSVEALAKGLLDSILSTETQSMSVLSPFSGRTVNQYVGGGETQEVEIEAAKYRNSDTGRFPDVITEVIDFTGRLAIQQSGDYNNA